MKGWLLHNLQMSYDWDKKGGCVLLEQLIYKHSLLQLFPKTEVIIIRQLEDLNWRCCSEKHHLIKCHNDLD